MTFIYVVFVITGRYSPVSTPIRSLRTGFHALDTFFDIKTRELLVLLIKFVEFSHFSCQIFHVRSNEITFGRHLIICLLNIFKKKVTN